MNNKVVHITVEGGVIQHVECPQGVKAIVRDYDADGMSGSSHRTPSKKVRGSSGLDDKKGCRRFADRRPLLFQHFHVSGLTTKRP